MPQIWVSRMNSFFCCVIMDLRTQEENGVVNPCPLTKGSFLRVCYGPWPTMVRITLSSETPYTFKNFFKELKSEGEKKRETSASKTSKTSHFCHRRIPNCFQLNINLQRMCYWTLALGTPERKSCSLGFFILRPVVLTSYKHSQHALWSKASIRSSYVSCGEWLVLRSECDICLFMCVHQTAWIPGG